MHKAHIKQFDNKTEEDMKLNDIKNSEYTDSIWTKPTPTPKARFLNKQPAPTSSAGTSGTS